MSLKLLSLNMEGHKHLDRVFELVKQEHPDVICLQEVFEVDMPLLEQTFGMKGRYAAMADVRDVSIHQAHAFGSWGLAQFTTLPVIDSRAEYYVGQPDELPIFFSNNNPNAQNRVLLVATVEKEGQSFTIGTTHFTWSTGGKYTPEQAENFHALSQILDQLPELILCGDLNSPRQGEVANVFHQLAERYTDTIPPEITTSIDGQFHKAGQLELMVDSLFSTPQYQVKNVRVIGGVSDHKAVVGEVALTDIIKS